MCFISRHFTPHFNAYCIAIYKPFLLSAKNVFGRVRSHICIAFLISSPANLHSRNASFGGPHSDNPVELGWDYTLGGGGISSNFICLIASSAVGAVYGRALSWSERTHLDSNTLRLLRIANFRCFKSPLFLIINQKEYILIS